MSNTRNEPLEVTVARIQADRKQQSDLQERKAQARSKYYLNQEQREERAKLQAFNAASPLPIHEKCEVTGAYVVATNPNTGKAYTRRNTKHDRTTRVSAIMAIFTHFKNLGNAIAPSQVGILKLMKQFHGIEISRRCLNDDLAMMEANGYIKRIRRHTQAITGELNLKTTLYLISDLGARANKAISGAVKLARLTLKRSYETILGSHPGIKKKVGEAKQKYRNFVDNNAVTNLAHNPSVILTNEKEYGETSPSFP